MHTRSVECVDYFAVAWQKPKPISNQTFSSLIVCLLPSYSLDLWWLDFVKRPKWKEFKNFEQSFRRFGLFLTRDFWQDSPSKFINDFLKCNRGMKGYLMPMLSGQVITCKRDDNLTIRLVFHVVTSAHTSRSWAFLLWDVRGSSQMKRFFRGNDQFFFAMHIFNDSNKKKCKMPTSKKHAQCKNAMHEMQKRLCKCNIHNRWPTRKTLYLSSQSSPELSSDSSPELPSSNTSWWSPSGLIAKFLPSKYSPPAARHFIQRTGSWFTAAAKSVLGILLSSLCTAACMAGTLGCLIPLRAFLRRGNTK